MVKRLTWLAVFLFSMRAFAAVETTTISGTVIRPNGSAVTAGTVTATLSSAGTASDGVGSVVVAATTSATINASGFVTLILVPNDVISPSGTFYTVKYSTTSPSPSTAWTEKWTVTTAPDPISLGDVTRIDQPPGMQAPVSTILDEGTALHKRTGLNFVGSAVTCIDDSTNSRVNCTFTGTGGGGITNGDKGDITVASDGESLTIDADAVSTTELSDVTLTTPATGSVLVKSAGDWIDGQVDLADTDAVTGILPDANIASTITRDSEAAAAYQPTDADLTAIAALGCSTGQVLKIAGGVWVCGTDDTIGSGAVTGTGVADRVALWNGTSAIDSDTGMTFNRGTDALTATTFIGALSGNATTATTATTATNLVGSGSTTGAVDLATAEVAGTLPAASVGTGLTDAQVSDTLTASVFKGSGTTTDAVDLATAEVSGTLGDANVSDTITASNYQLLDSDLTTIAALSCSDTQVVKRSGGVWVCGTDDTIGGGAVTGSGVADRVALWSGTGAIDSDTGMTYNRTTDTLTTTTFVGALTGTATNATNYVGAALADSQVSNTLTSSIFVGSGSTTNAVDLATAEVAGVLANANTTATSANTASAIVARGSSGEFSAGAMSSNSGNYTACLSGGIPSTCSATSSSGVRGLWFNRLDADSTATGMGWARTGIERWGLGEDYYAGTRSYFVPIYSDKATPTGSGWSSNDVMSVSWGGAELDLGASSPRVVGQSGVDGPKFRFNSFFTPSSNLNTYSGSYQYEFYLPTNQTSGTGITAALFQSDRNSAGSTVAFDSGGIQINTTGARVGLNLVNETNGGGTRKAYIAAGKGGSTGFAFGTDIPATDTQNWSIYDYAAAATRFYLSPTGYYGFNTGAAVGSDFMTGLFTQNAPTKMKIDNQSAGNAARAGFTATSDVAYVTMESYSSALSDAAYAGDAMLYVTGTGAQLHLGTAGVKRVTISDTAARVGIGIDPPTEALDVSGNGKFTGTVTAGSFDSPASATLGGCVTMKEGTDDAPSGAGSEQYVAICIPDSGGVSSTVRHDLNATGTFQATSIGGGAVSDTEFGYLDGVTSALQTQLDSKTVSTQWDTAAEINTATTDADFVTLDATAQTLTASKTITESTGVALVLKPTDNATTTPVLQGKSATGALKWKLYANDSAANGGRSQSWYAVDGTTERSFIRATGVAQFYDGTATGIPLISSSTLSTGYAGALALTGGVTISTLPLIPTSGIKGSLLLDLDRDGTNDYAFVGDWNSDGLLNNTDIEAASVALPSGKKVLELAAGVWNVNVQNDGIGHTAGCTGYNPHICLRTGTTLKGQGEGVTILRFSSTSPAADQGYGSVPIIGNDVDSATFCPVATTRTSNIHVSDLTVETTAALAQITTASCVSNGSPAACCTGSGTGTCGQTFNPGIRYTDCDDCTVDHVTAKEFPHAGVQFIRGTRNRGSFIRAYHVGNYIHGTETANAVQPCLYMYSSCGFVAADNSFTDSMCDGVGGGLIARGDDGIARPVPLGETGLDFSSGVVRIAQTFKILAAGDYAGGGFRPSAIWLWIKTPSTSAITGNIDVAIFDTSAGAPNAVKTGYDYTDWSATIPATSSGYDSASLTHDFRLVRFQRISTAPTPLAIVGGADTSFAIVVKYAGGIDKVHLESDANATDTYTGGSIYTAGSGGSWSAGTTGYDLNFFVENGTQMRPVFKGITINDIHGLGTTQVTATYESSVGGLLSDVRATRAGGFQLGSQLSTQWTMDTTLSGFSLEDVPTAATSAGVEFGEYAVGSQLRNGTIRGTARTAYGQCLNFREWSRDASVVGVQAYDCYSYGVYLTKGLRNISITNSTFTGVGDNAIHFAQYPACTTNLLDGVSCSQKSVRIANNSFVNVVGAGIAATSDPDNAQENLQIVGNTFTDLGAEFLRTASTTAQGPWLIANNITNGWGHRSGSRYAFDLYFDHTKITGLSVTGNVFNSTNAGETRGFMVDMTDADSWTIANNQVNGTLGDAIYYLFNNTATKKFLFNGNLPSLGSTSDSTPAWAANGTSCTDACLHSGRSNCATNGSIPLDGTNTGVACSGTTGNRMCLCY